MSSRKSKRRREATSSSSPLTRTDLLHHYLSALESLKEVSDQAWEIYHRPSQSDSVKLETLELLLSIDKTRIEAVRSGQLPDVEQVRKGLAELKRKVG
jgi:hypothetical protein